MLAEGRVLMYTATGDQSYLTRPYMQLVINGWDKQWVEDMSVPTMAYELAGQRGLIK